ncbi:MAG: cobalamin-dependent protein [Deltaproteobacteria bacterium]|nr:cobalamin-dependent protein [Deltaproteobacteria bacterium]
MTHTTADWTQRFLSEAPMQEHSLSTSNQDAREAIWAALEGFERGAVLRVVQDFLRDGASRADLYVDVLQPLLYDLGDRWERSEISVAFEHYVTGVMLDVLARWSVVSRVELTSNTLVGACVEGETHTLGLRMTCDVVEAEGWTVHYLGADVPTVDLLTEVAIMRPSAVLLSVTQPASILKLSTLIAALRTEYPELAIVVGGQAINRTESLWRELGADAHATDARTTLAALRSIKRLQRG